MNVTCEIKCQIVENKKIDDGILNVFSHNLYAKKVTLNTHGISIDIDGEELITAINNCSRNPKY